MAEDSKGNDIPDPYQPDEDGMVEVYEITPGASHDVTIVRSWHQMFDEVEAAVEKWNRNREYATVLTIKVEAIKVTPHKWRRFCEETYRGEECCIDDIEDEEPLK
jgi:hypothetical protein